MVDSDRATFVSKIQYELCVSMSVRQHLEIRFQLDRVYAIFLLIVFPFSLIPKHLIFRILFYFLFKQFFLHRKVGIILCFGRRLFTVPNLK